MNKREQALFNAFAPVVKRMLGEREQCEYSVRFFEKTSNGTDVYYFVVKLVGDVTAHQIADIATRLNAFCTYEEDDACVTIDNHEFWIGDGDDSLAVMFGNREFLIWIRDFDAQENAI